MQRRTQFALVASLCLAGLPAVAAGGEEPGSEKVQALVHRVLQHSADGPKEEKYDKKNAPGLALSRLLSMKPDAMAYVAPPLFAAIDSTETSDHQVGALLEAVLGSGSPALAGLGDELLERAPERLADPYVLAFAESGSDGALQRVTRQVKKGKGGAMAAAFLGFRGDKVARKSLGKYAKMREIQPDQAVDVLIAGHALAALGDAKACRAAQLRVQDATLAALDRGELKSAQHLAGAALLVERIMRYDEPRLSMLGKQIGSARKEVEKKYASADDVFALIERVTPVL